MVLTNFIHPTTKLFAVTPNTVYARVNKTLYDVFTGLLFCNTFPGATSAYIMLVNQTRSNSDNYILDNEETSVTINTFGYTTGLNSVILVVDNDIQNSKSLLIQ